MNRSIEGRPGRSHGLAAIAGLIVGLSGCGHREPVPPMEPFVSPPPPPGFAYPKIKGMLMPGPRTKPTPVLMVQTPKPPSQTFHGRNVAELPAPLLAAMARQLFQEGKYRDAAQVQYWVVKAGGSGQRLLACWSAMAGDVDAGFYWLQDAGLSDSVEPTWAEHAPDLVALRDDPRWAELVPYLQDCYQYWRTSGKHENVVILPKGCKLGTPIGIVVSLHGHGGEPHGFVTDFLQKYADELNMAFVGVSATFPIGNNVFMWSEDPESDTNQIRRALKEISDRLTVDPKHVVLFGFSQGGQMAFEIAYQHPDEFRGAIAVSPGSTNPFDRFDLLLPPSPGHRNQGYVFQCGADEPPGKVAAVRTAADFVKKAGARVELKIHEGMSTPALPSNFEEILVRQVRFINGLETP